MDRNILSHCRCWLMVLLVLVTCAPVAALVLSSSLMVALFSTPAAAQRATGEDSVERPPEVVLKEFYRWYIHSVSRQIDPLKAGKATLRKYVTLRFIRVMERNEKLPEGEGFDADYFLQTQEDSSVTDKNISVSNVAIRGATATAIVTFDDGYPRVKVSLTKEGGVWKIDNVKDASAPAR
jgi:Protein of unknown function (DUF3828)